jgi:hypothetical protein
MFTIKAIAVAIIVTLMFAAVLYVSIFLPRGAKNLEDIRRELSPSISDTVGIGDRNIPAGPPPPTVQYIESEVIQDSTALVQTEADTAALQREIERLAQEKRDLEETKITGLAKLYEAMKPDAAAAILTNLDDQKIIKILNKMKARQVAKILTSNAMPPQRAAQITKLMRQGER